MAEIRSPLPGIFYRCPAPEAPPFKDVGDTIAVDDLIGLVEVMKSFIEIKADAAGKIVRFAVENEDAVMAGDVLVELEG